LDNIDDEVAGLREVRRVLSGWVGRDHVPNANTRCWGHDNKTLETLFHTRSGAVR
jgi:hypothetical protein